MNCDLLQQCPVICEWCEIWWASGGVVQNVRNVASCGVSVVGELLGRGIELNPPVHYGEVAMGRPE